MILLLVKVPLPLLRVTVLKKTVRKTLKRRKENFRLYKLRDIEMDPIEFVQKETDYALCFFDLSHMMKKTKLKNHLKMCKYNQSSKTTKCEICLDSFPTFEVYQHLLKHQWRELGPYQSITDYFNGAASTHLVCFYNENHVVKTNRFNSHLQKCNAIHWPDCLIKCHVCNAYFLNMEVLKHLKLHINQRKTLRYSFDGKRM